MALAIPMMAEAAEWRTDLGKANSSSIGMETGQADGSASGRASASFEAPVGMTGIALSTIGDEQRQSRL